MYLEAVIFPKDPLANILPLTVNIEVKSDTAPVPTPIWSPLVWYIIELRIVLGPVLDT